MAEIIIPRKYYDGSYCPKCLSINYDIYDIELDYSRSKQNNNFSKKMINSLIKLLNYLKSKKIKTLQSDEYYKNKDNVDKKVLLKKSDIIILCTPHKAYKNLKIKKNKVLVDIWSLIEKK